MLEEHERSSVQRNFLKYTGQQILKLLKDENSELLNALLVNTKDRYGSGIRGVFLYGLIKLYGRNFPTSMTIPLKQVCVNMQKIIYSPVPDFICKGQALGFFDSC